MRIGKPLRLRPSLIGLGITILLSARASPTLAQDRDGVREPPGPRVSRASDPVTLTFVFLGCNRIQHADWKATKAEIQPRTSLSSSKRSGTSPASSRG